MSPLGYWTWRYAWNEILCGVHYIIAIEHAVLEELISREVVA